MAPGKLATSLVPLLLHSFGRRWSRLIRWKGRQAFKGGYKAVFPSTSSKVIYWESFEYYICCGSNLPKSCTIYLLNVHKDDLRNFHKKAKNVFCRDELPALCVLCAVRCHCIFYDAVADTIRRKGGYRGIITEEGVTFFGGNHGSRV